MQRLSAKQKNHLSAGYNLAAEVSPTLIGHRKFIVIRPYVTKDIYGYEIQSKPNKYLNDLNKVNTLLFSILLYEVSQEDLNKEYDMNNDDIKLRKFISEVRGIEKLESILNNLEFDLSALDAEWKCENPI